MRVFYFTEQPYPDAWDAPGLRVDIPNALCDPHKAGELYNRYLDEFCYADQQGLNIMINEHHSTATCISASSSLLLTAIARETRKARLLTLGVPLSNRPDPLRVAEEMAMIDCISGGRLEMGFVKGAPYEIPLAPTNPVMITERLWEAHDLILKAMTTTDGPFSWTGDLFHYHNVNIWPRPIQAPPPVWITSLSPSSAPRIALHDHVVATVLCGERGTRALFDAYRAAYREQGKGEAPADRFAYAALIAIADNEAEAYRRAVTVQEYLTGGRVAKQFAIPPGYHSPEAVARMSQQVPFTGDLLVEGSDGKKFAMHSANVEKLRDIGVLFWGTPDQVYNQIVDFYGKVGGFANLLLMAQAGHLSAADTRDSIDLIAREVMPRLVDFHESSVRTVAA